MIRVAGRVEAWQLRAFGVSTSSLLLRRRLLVLETTGRRTGRTRRTPLAYLRDDGGTLLVGGGAGGMTTVPDWVRNLRACADAAVWVRRSRFEVRVEELTGGAREEAHRRARASWREVDDFEARSGRPVPYFRLVPVP